MSETDKNEDSPKTSLLINHKTDIQTFASGSE